jgi:electron transfer flavoprotein beta subunit
MRGMDIAVCVKHVATLGDEVDFDGSGTDVDPDYLEWALNEWDVYAVEEALRLREAAGEGEPAAAVPPAGAAPPADVVAEPEAARSSASRWNLK